MEPILDITAAPVELDAPTSDLEIPCELSVLAQKRELFAVDNYFREAWWDLAPLHQALSRLAVIVFKPDALVGRRIVPCLRLLGEHGYTILAGRVFRYDRHLIRETWRYQFNIASRERIEVVDRLLTATPSLLVVIGECESGEVPASVRLGSLKGPSEPSLRRAGEIRHELGVLTSLFNFIHTSDEPLDVVREIGVALDLDTRRSLVAEIATWRDSARAVVALASELEAVHDAHDLDRDRALERLSRSDDDRVRRGARRARAGDASAWREILAAVPCTELWDALSVATASIECNVPGLQALLPSVAGHSGLRAWRDRRGSRA